MKDKVVGGLQSLAKALMGAVAVLPVAALLVGIGYRIDPEGWGANSLFADLLIKSGLAVLENLGLIFAVAIAFGLAKDKNGAAALSGMIGFLTVTKLLNADAVAGYRGIDVESLEGQQLLEWAAQGWKAVGNGNVLFGILIGILAAWTYNRFESTKLPDFLAFFSGRRLVPILVSFFAMILSAVLFVLWPFVYGVLFNFGEAIQGMGAIGAGIYGFFNRLLIPTGLHHALNSIFWFDVIGINDIGNFLKGGETIAAAAAATDQASCPGTWTGSTCEVIGVVGRYQAGFFPVMMFGLPGAALAMFLRARPERRKVVGSLMLAGALASFATGVTEPLEFSFMFVAPLLYLVHALLTGLAVGIAAAMGWTAGFGFSAGAFDMSLSTGNPIANQWWMLLVMGAVYFALYFGIFYALIGALNLRTPGRDDESDDAADAVVVSDESVSGVARQIIAGLGGAANISSIDYCATRLRVLVNDYVKVSEKEIKKAGVAGVIRPSQTAVQVVIGPNVQFVYDEVVRQLSGAAVAFEGEKAE
ncbi:N-acetylglucosamine-specific PTS transporter subunit IIBC [Corynebacterium felinum]|uniref:PTS system N-acetylglucosamine-specific IIC component n=1 Tax=Corynebacterium felinum TaxID=131318 RepID=A0ABU2B5A7_9CORY|nr:N-acetylglucosamine-specific PTS transporter subunit IIBC [Corynebacterium felinum]MDF5821442.1 N-acetylglucosamine-specific PTS transporter subunit IIBC [Corynebacterium felinum]MDR7353793.1 PTS system N-acetylglucosamine-specific IIC component [Corynebacterium felinum]WJY95972.1 PTS system glucose-specific EIICBA component [Corynebacterium felinum]